MVVFSFYQCLGSRTSVTATTWGAGTHGQVRELWWGAAEAQAFLDLEGRRRWLAWPIYRTGSVGEHVPLPSINQSC